MQHRVLLQLAEEDDVCLATIERGEQLVENHLGGVRVHPPEPALAHHAESPHRRRVDRGVPELAGQPRVHDPRHDDSLDPAATLDREDVGLEDMGLLADRPQDVVGIRVDAVAEQRRPVRAQRLDLRDGPRDPDDAAAADARQMPPAGLGRRGPGEVGRDRS